MYRTSLKAFFIISIIMSCGKKDLPISTEDVVTFYCKATVDGTPILLQAGKNNIYMLTSLKKYTLANITSWQGSFVDSANTNSPQLSFDFMFVPNQLIDNNFSNTNFTTPVFDTTFLTSKTCGITYYKNGNIYYSTKNNIDFVPSNHVAYTSISYNVYGVNNNSQQTLKLNGYSDCYLYNKSNASDSIHFVTNDLWFSIAFD